MRACTGIANPGGLRPVGAPLACAGEVGVVREPRRGGDERGLWNHNKKVREKEKQTFLHRAKERPARCRRLRPILVVVVAAVVACVPTRAGVGKCCALVRIQTLRVT
jgi:hypothetical protein